MTNDSIFKSPNRYINSLQYKLSPIYCLTVGKATDTGVLKVKVKVNCTLVQAQRLCTGRAAHSGSRGIALLFLDHGTRRGWGVTVTPRTLFTPGKDPVPIVQEAGWAPGIGLDRCGKSRSLPWFDPRTVEPVVSRYTDWAIPAHVIWKRKHLIALLEKCRLKRLRSCSKTDFLMSDCNEAHTISDVLAKSYCQFARTLLVCNKEFLCITLTVKHNYISSSSTVGIQLHVSALYVGHLQVVM